jgi:CheY-like chemotaxis protein
MLKVFLITRRRPTAHGGVLVVPTDVQASDQSTVLIADADAATRALYRESLQLSGWQVVEASDGRDALMKALADPPSLIMTEMALPFIDGSALCEILRRDRATADVPILVLTADTRPSQIERARRMGADAVLVKPATPEQIVAETARLTTITNSQRRRTVAATVTANPSRTRARSRSFQRFTTTTPPVDPPILLCPSCDRPLAYVQSYIGGVSERHAEQWDEYHCTASCGTFQYRHRTRKVQRVE